MRSTSRPGVLSAACKLAARLGERSPWHPSSGPTGRSSSSPETSGNSALEMLHPTADAADRRSFDRIPLPAPPLPQGTPADSTFESECVPLDPNLRSPSPNNRGSEKHTTMRTVGYHPSQKS